MIPSRGLGNQYSAYFRHHNSRSGVLWPGGKLSTGAVPMVIDVLMGGFDEAMQILLGSAQAAHLKAGDTVVLLNTDTNGGLRVFKLVRMKPVDPPLSWEEV